MAHYKHLTAATMTPNTERLSRPPAHETFFFIFCPKCHRELIGNKETRGHAWCARCQQWRKRGANANA